MADLADYEKMLADLNVPKATVYPVLKGRVAIVTGAAAGMGKATAKIFAEAGASVIVADINEAGAKEVAAEIEKDGGKAHAVKTDISNEASVQNMVNEAVEKFGGLDCAVNNAAMIPDSTPIKEFDKSQYEKILSVNLTGTLLYNKYEIQQMRKQGRGGAIVNISSTAAYFAQPNMVGYTTSKHAIVGLTKQAAAENADAKIRVNTVAPGPILTELSARSMILIGMDHEAYAKRASLLGRWAAPHEVAQASLWLCSDAASFVTSTCLPVDAGSHTKF